MHDIELKLALLGFAGIAAQWIAWRIHLPAIVLLLIIGLIAGPVTGYLNPAIDFGDVYKPVISLCVAIILFEGGLTLNFKEIAETSTAVRRIIIFGGPMVWALGTLAGHYIGGLTWQTAILLGAILVVTGPTVIMPLLRQARLKPRPASLLRWEAIVNDPIGALLAVVSFEIFLILNNAGDAEHFLTNGAIAAVIALPGAYFLARFLAWIFTNGHVAEFLKAPVLVAVAVAASSFTNIFLEEAGLLTVTVMGITLANSRMASLTEMRRFKETITILLVSGVFILLTASLKISTMQGLGWEVVGFVAAMLFVVRPVAIFIATIGSGLTWQERLLSAWIAPRGIVAVAVAGLFGATLVEQGISDGEKMVAYTFAVVAATILLHGFSLPILARILNLKSAAKPGILLIGGSPWSTALASKLLATEIPVQIADENWNHLKSARAQNIPTYYGDILSEHAHHEINMASWASVITATDNDAYNALVCTELGPEIGRGNVFQIGHREGGGNKRELHFTLGGRPLMRPGFDFTELDDKIQNGWVFSSSILTKEYDYNDHLETIDDEAIILFWSRANGSLIFPSINPNAVPGEGDLIITFGQKNNPATKHIESQKSSDIGSNP